jgi:hypothetical protein
MYPEDLFFDNFSETRVASLSLVNPGSWYLDYSNRNVYLGDDPSGHMVEISLLPHAFSGYARSVLIENMIIEKCASVASQGAGHGIYGTGRTVA